MRKLTITLLTLILFSQAGYCDLSKNDINIFNLKTQSMYILDLDSSVKNINISNRDIVDINSVTSLTNDKKQLFIEANKTGVCDAVITTDSNTYQIRFISGPTFQDKRKELTQIDIPTQPVFMNEGK